MAAVPTRGFPAWESAGSSERVESTGPPEVWYLDWFGSVRFVGLFTSACLVGHPLNVAQLDRKHEVPLPHRPSYPAYTSKFLVPDTLEPGAVVRILDD